jgi:hypothetical protein
MKASKWKAISRVTKSFNLRVGGLEAEGVPAVILAWAGIVLAVGVVRALDRNAPVLPEAFREAKGLLEAVRGERGSAPLASYHEA